MLKLWQVNGVDFETKEEAKAFRNEHGGKVSKGKYHKAYGVVRPNSIHPKRKRK
jgi:hypothetical protein